ncbi:MAG: PilZ domain-containing protein [Cyanobacteria bacterium J06635_1]
MNQATALDPRDTFTEKREFPRKKKSLAYQIGSPLSARKPTVDISRGGTCIYSDKRLKVGKRLKIKFFAHGQAIVAKAHVVWVKEANANAPAQFQVGLKFAEISDQQLDLLLTLSGQPVLSSPSPLKMMFGAAATVCMVTAATPAAAQAQTSDILSVPAETSFNSEMDLLEADLFSAEDLEYLNSFSSEDFDFSNLNGTSSAGIQLSEESSESVPEPGVIGGLAAAGVTLAMRRRKR